MNEVTNSQANNLKFNDVYNEYKPLIEYFLRNKIKNEETREDIVIETFMRVSKHLHVFNPDKAKLTTWIHTIANRLVIDEYRKAKASISESDLSTIEDSKAFEFVGNSCANSDVENRELRHTIRKAMRNLKPIEKRMAILRLVKEYEYTEIAEILDIPLNSVKATIFRAKESLQTSLKSEYALLG
jgi:RNA polymerase sigma factor (sigma-70 family)